MMSGANAWKSISKISLPARDQLALENFISRAECNPSLMKPSGFYRSELWRAALVAARFLPGPILNPLAVSLASAYGGLCRTRRGIVARNLLPPLQMDGGAAERASSELFRQFGLKLADLWRYEAGLEPPEPSITTESWRAFQTLLEEKRGILLLTPHIGNWELGAPFLRRRNVNLQVITQAEPNLSLTRLRAKSRARWGIETLVIGENPFGFVEVIRRLEEGAVVALLMDRPPPASSVTVKLFGHRFPASIAAAELARASGCALLPVALPREKSGYSIKLYPEIPYERTALGNREARANLTQEIMRQFEPIIREYLTQWFHFVPLWQPTKI
jgi:lauroyl/myristoyl acyltransferase